MDALRLLNDSRKGIPEGSIQACSAAKHKQIDLNEWPPNLDASSCCGGAANVLGCTSNVGGFPWGPEKPQSNCHDKVVLITIMASLALRHETVPDESFVLSA